MPTAPQTHHRFKPDIEHRRKAERERQAAQAERRGTAAERGYGARWQATRVGFLRRHPLCECCKANGRVTAAEVVDHIVPHKGDMGLFWDRANWQALCNVPCHQRIKQGVERRYWLGEVDARALRLDYPMPEAFIETV